ncbi:aminotransferase class I/II-fold pyridoxal phosphate-dependent enzyme [Mariniblastus sp.]|nr:aminotransferase class I/II-fold pyridoxal phosphate-dependent enzyme [bacterium]MDC3223402.1 aminotransferase class I/II-fold pyridoxal phosphate-dependent enzyme [Mariniblastus sp.]
MNKNSPKRIYLSPPCMLGGERELLMDAFDSNWIAPLGPHVNQFEIEFAECVGTNYAVALSSGTAAIHLALLLNGVEEGDEVLTASFTFAATANAITYANARPVFIDSETASWNLDPELVEVALSDSKKAGKLPKAVLAVDILGQTPDYERLSEICNRYNVPIIEDAAEALGASYRKQPAGNFGTAACFSFNGNKIITTSGGGMLATNRKDWAEKARFLATQSRDPAAHYEHSEIGYNYRMSNLLAAVGRGQLKHLDTHVNRRRAIFDRYYQALKDLPGIGFMPEIPEGRSTRWLSVITIDSSLFGASREDVRLALEAENIESRPAWKPMHLQPVFADCKMYGGEVSEGIFKNGLSLPSGTNLTETQQLRVIDKIIECAN